MERREHPRIKADLTLNIDDAGSVIESQVENISCSGVYCRTKKLIPLMTKVMVALFLPYSTENKVGFNKLKCEGIIVRTQEVAVRDEIVYKTAIYFSSITKPEKNKIVSFIEHQLHKNFT